jgi:transposase
LQSDGYSAYTQYAEKMAITHAECWAHARRKIFDARDIEPAQADQALHAISQVPYVLECGRITALAACSR